LVTRHLKIDLRPFLSLSHDQKFLGDEGDYRPLQTHQTEGAHPPSGNPLMYYFDRGHAEKVVTFCNNIFQTKNSVSGLNMTFLHCFRLQNWWGGDKKPSKHAYMREKVNLNHLMLLFLMGNEYRNSNLEF
jgi:hypothetical protein